MSTKQIHVFISHSWAYSDHYETLYSWIFHESWRVGQASLDFRDNSIPRNDPVHNARTDKELQQAIFNKIMRSHVIVIPTGKYASYSKWIKKEIDGSKLYSKPILAIKLWASQRGSSVVKNSATRVVGWNKKPIISNIWDLYKN